MEDFYRIRRLPPYVFEQVNRAKAAARNAGADIIDLGMGNPDLPTPPQIQRISQQPVATRCVMKCFLNGFEFKQLGNSFAGDGDGDVCGNLDGGDSDRDGLSTLRLCASSRPSAKHR